MALTLEVEQRLRAVRLTELFEEHREDWLGYAKRVYGFVKQNYPAGSEVRQDDVAMSLFTIDFGGQEAYRQTCQAETSTEILEA